MWDGEAGLGHPPWRGGGGGGGEMRISMCCGYFGGMWGMKFFGLPEVWALVCTR